MRGKLLIAATVVAFLLAVVFLVSRESRWDPRYTPIDLGSGPVKFRYFGYVVTGDAEGEIAGIRLLPLWKLGEIVDAVREAEGVVDRCGASGRSEGERAPGARDAGGISAGDEKRGDDTKCDQTGEEGERGPGEEGRELRPLRDEFWNDFSHPYFITIFKHFNSRKFFPSFTGC